MKLVRTLALTLGLSFATGGLFAGSALADDGRDKRQERWDDNDDGRGDRGDRGDWGDRGDRGDWGGKDWNGRDDDQSNARCEHDDDDAGRWDRPGRWGRFVPVRFVNHRDQFVTLYLNGRYLGRIAPNSRDRIALPPGNHIVTYQVGRRNRFHQVSVDAFPGQRSRVVIEGRHGGHWGGGWGGGW